MHFGSFEYWSILKKKGKGTGDKCNFQQALTPLLNLHNLYNLRNLREKPKAKGTSLNRVDLYLLYSLLLIE